MLGTNRTDHGTIGYTLGWELLHSYDLMRFVLFVPFGAVAIDTQQSCLHQNLTVGFFLLAIMGIITANEEAT